MKFLQKFSLYGFLLLFSMHLYAAEFSITKSSGDAPDLISLNGEILDGDEVKFRKISAESDTAIISLNSPGGDIYPALKIGKLIRAMSYSTKVESGAECNSSCASIWLAGQYKYLSKTSRIGFHEPFDGDHSKQEESKIKHVYGLLGAYYQSIGLSDGVIFYLLDFSVKPIKWLTQSNAQIYGVSITESR